LTILYYKRICTFFTEGGGKYEMNEKKTEKFIHFRRIWRERNMREKREKRENEKKT